MHLRPTQHCFTGKSSSISRLVPNGFFFSQTFTIECFFFFFLSKKCFSFFLTDSNLCCSWSFFVDWVRKPMYYSCQPTTTCSDQSEQRFSNVPSYSFVLGLLLKCRSSVIPPFSFLYLFIFLTSILASLVWQNLTVGWMNSASAAGQKGNVI